MSVLEILAERRIAEGMEAGAFDDLPGRGRRLDLDDDAAVPGEWRAAFRLLKNAGLAPEWVTLGRRIDAWRSRLQALGRERGTAAVPADEVAALNRAIDDYNLRAPHARFQRLKLKV
jgi:hypothetical protein